MSPEKPNGAAGGSAQSSADGPAPLLPASEVQAAQSRVVEVEAQLQNSRALLQEREGELKTELADERQKLQRGSVSLGTM